MGIRETIASWLVPSAWIDWLNGRKRILGAVCLVLWVAIYAVPAMCVTDVCSTIAVIGAKARDLLMSMGLDLDSALLTTGGALTVVGLADWLVKHFFSNLISGLLKKIESGVANVMD